ncbi:MAG: OmpP1/FadL family transporter [Candidatus Krumholzibacteriia bacterium]
MSGTTRIAVLALVLLVQPGGSRATSLFSMNLLGERLEAGDVHSIALGGSGQLLQDSLGVLQLNPALLARLPRVTVGVTQFLAIDEGRSTEFAERDISFTFSSFRAAFPLSRNLIFAIGYRGRYDPGGSFAEREVTPAGDEFTSTFSKSGGLFSVPLTLAFGLSRFASVGLTFSFEQGFVQDRQDLVFNDPTFAPSAGIKKESFNGNGYAAGVVLYPTASLSVGAMWESAIDYDTEIIERFTPQSVLDTFYTATARLPSSAGFGVAWQVSEQYLVAGSAAFRDFDGFEGLAFPASRLRREESYSIGGEYKKGVRIKGRRYPLRLSFSYEKLPFDQPGSQDVKKFLVGFGTGIRLSGGRGKVDLAVQGGKVGSINNNGLEDRVFRIYLGISGSEVWKRKTGEF